MRRAVQGVAGLHQDEFVEGVVVEGDVALVVVPQNPRRSRSVGDERLPDMVLDQGDWDRKIAVGLC